MKSNSPSILKDDGSAASAVRTYARFRGPLFAVILGIMLVLAALRLNFEGHRLLVDPAKKGAVDLMLRHHEVQTWFAGHEVYGKLEGAIYPPASYLILRPLLDPVSAPTARWIWAALSVAALAWLIPLLLRGSGAEGWMEKLWIVLLVLAANATGITIGNGQLILLVLPLLLTGIFLFCRRNSLTSDLVGAVLSVGALISPSNAVPFFWLILLVPGRLRPALLTAGLYALLTVISSAWQPEPCVALLLHWLRFATHARHSGYGNQMAALQFAGLRAWAFPVTVTMLLGLAAFVFRHRRGDLWLLLAVTAIVGRLSTYHRVYDDLIILLPMVALVRLVHRHPLTEPRGKIALALLVGGWFFALAPARILDSSPPWNWMMICYNSLIWIAMLLFLIWQLERDRVPLTLRSQ